MKVDNLTNSGLVAEVRHLTGRELRQLRLRAQEKDFNPMTYAIQCAVTVTSAGIYKNIDDWNQVYSGDRLTLWHKIREATKGKIFNFDLRCPVRGCGSIIKWTLNLDELEIKKLPDEHKKMLASGNVFTEQLEGYGEVKLKYTNGYDEMNQIKDMGEYGEFTAMVLNQVVSVGNNSGPKAILKLLDEESGDLEDKLLMLCRKYEFGPETSIEVVCRNPRCQAVSTVAMPTGLSFFYDAIGQIT